MDDMKINGSILTKSFALGGNGAVTGLDFITQKPAQSARIMPMIEQRIRDEVEPRAQQAEKDLIAIISIELGKLGINPNLTGTHAYARGIADKYRERLVGERIDALVDNLVHPASTAVESAAKVSAKAGDVVVVTYPSTLTVDQHARLASRLASQFPDGVTVALLDGGAQLSHVVGTNSSQKSTPTG